MVELFFWTFLAATPAFAANMSPVFAKKLNIFKFLDYPVDFKKTFLGKRIFGDHKTFRGIVIGTISGFLISLFLFLLIPLNQTPFLYLTNYLQFAVYGALAGFGAMAGDTIKSFFKKQLNIKSGTPFIPFDQIDYIIGFLLATSLLVGWRWEQILFLLIFTIIFHPLTNIAG